MSAKPAKNLLRSIGSHVQQHFSTNKRVLSFEQYMRLVAENPRRHVRSTAQYLRDMFDFFGSETVATPRGKLRRFKLFDAPWDNGTARLVGQEEVQNHLYRLINNFARQGRIDRFILLHGPNGSSKSTVTEMLPRAMEHYSSLDEGALYRFNWIFPTRGTGRKDIGFQGDLRPTDPGDSYAHLEDAAVDARLPCELRDHPLLLLPEEQRGALLDELLATADADAHSTTEEFRLGAYIRHGCLSHKNKLIYEALLAAYDGDYLRVLRHVQVERYYVSRRYRLGAGRVEPQLAIDARTRQVTADRSLAALPTALQNIALHETEGELVDANRGVLDFADLLKRPPEAYKYLLTAVESGRVVLGPTNIYVDLLYLGSANENHLNAFMESPEWMSFKARFELIRVPYLRDYTQEIRIYEQLVTEESIGKRIGPFAIEVAALWAVLTRMHRPDLARYEGELKELLAKISPLERAAFFAETQMPAGTSEEAARTLRAEMSKIYGESDDALIYEGRTGASPREIRATLMNAAQDTDFECLTPEAVLKHIEALARETSVYAFLRQETQGNGFFDHRGFIEICRDWYLGRADEAVRSAMGLVEESRYAELFSRYINHVTHHVRKEQLLNPMTGNYEDPDERFMSDVEKSLEVKDEAMGFRQDVITKIGAWSVDHPGERPDYPKIFADHFAKLREGYYDRQRKRVSKTIADALKLFADADRSHLAKDDLQAVETMLARLRDEYHYPDACARETLTMLARRRYAG